jgi:hypothetical protein
MYRVNENKLNELDPEKLIELARKGVLARLYSHLLSLENFRRLSDRAAAMEPTAAPAASSLQ